MPELLFHVRWPDETVTRCYSPSRAIAAHLDAATRYTLPEFMTRSRAGLHAASERVREIYGAPCSRAAAQLAELERIAARFADRADAHITVETIETI
jgi:uncharacterized repeat protein (TIGR04042 family)